MLILSQCNFFYFCLSWVFSELFHLFFGTFFPVTGLSHFFDNSSWLDTDIFICIFISCISYMSAKWDVIRFSVKYYFTHQAIGNNEVYLILFSDNLFFFRYNNTYVAIWSDAYLLSFPCYAFEYSSVYSCIHAD